MRVRANLLLRIAGCSVGAALGCTATPVLVAATSDGGPSEGAPVESNCIHNHDCPEEAFCARPACGGVPGFCELRPFMCDNDFKPVCGCNGVIYWNDCLRQQDGVPASDPGTCDDGDSFATCGGSDQLPCPSHEAFCSKLVPGSSSACQLPPVGVCWVLPEVCPADDGEPGWQSCGPGPKTCTDLCSAIRSGEPFQSGMCP